MPRRFLPIASIVLLDELPLHLIPRRHRGSWRSQEDRQQSLYLDPDCILCPAGELPDELVSRQKLAGWIRSAGNRWRGCEVGQLEICCLSGWARNCKRYCRL